MTSEERHQKRRERRELARLVKRSKFMEKYDDFSSVFSWTHLYSAYTKCIHNVRWKASTQSYIADAPLRVNQTFEILKEEIYRSHGFYDFYIYERGKRRHIRSVGIIERVVQRCLCDHALVPVFQNSLIYDNGASTKHKGYTFAINRIHTHLERQIRSVGCNGYVLQFDFKSFFDNIPHKLLFDIIDKYFTDNKLKAQVKHFIKAFGDKGIGLGSQISQDFALISASALDHFIKEVLGIKGYGRYMDDGYLIHKSKEYLKYCLERIKAKCAELGLILNDKKTRIVSLTKGFTWLKIKFRISESGHIIKRPDHSSIVRMRQKLKKFKRNYEEHRTNITLDEICASYSSWKAHLKHTDSHNSVQRMKYLFNDLFHEHLENRHSDYNDCEVLAA